MGSRTRSYANVGESWYVAMLYVAFHMSTCRNLTMSNNVHTAILRSWGGMRRYLRAMHMIGAILMRETGST